MTTDLTQPPTDDLELEITARLGVMPNFFRTGGAAPGLARELWSFAKSAYLDSPLPSAFKERLFVHLSRFCVVRYCIVRHSGFMMGLGRPAGDASATPASVDDMVALLSRPISDGHALDGAQLRLEKAGASGLPRPGTPAEQDWFDVLSALFVDAPRAGRAREAVRHAAGPRDFELLMAYLAFVRTAHYWTETHPDLAIEADMQQLMQRDPTLAGLLMDDSVANRVHGLDALRGTLDELRESLRESEARQVFLLHLSDSLRPLSNPAQVMERAARALGQHLAANRCQYCEALPDEDTLVWGPGYEVDVMHLEGRLRISDFDPAILGLFRAGKTLVVDDFAGQISPERDATFEGVQLRAALAVPLVKEGRLVAVLSLHHASPRHWTDSQVKLAEDVAERTWAAVERARAEEALRLSETALREDDRRKDEFLATLAHELRNPLAPIRNALHLLRIAPDHVSTDRVHSMLDRQVTHMVRLLDELLEVSRISRGVIELQRRRLELGAVVGDAIEGSRPAIDLGRHTLEVSLPPTPVCVEGDAMRLAQVLSNLLNNAARYTDPGGRIALKLSRTDGEALVEVTDSGIGIAPERMAELFTMFGQIDRRDPRSQGGLGIGLALAQRLAQMHGGRVEATSEGHGRGSRFTLHLPLAPDSPGEQTPERPGDAAPGVKPRRVLVIDDNQDAADSTAMLLGVLGVETHVAYDGEAGLAAIQAWRPDIVLLDLGMPGMDGFEVARRIRADASLARLPLVALTGWGQQQDRQRTLEAGFDRHLVKPADPQALKAMLDTFAQ
jgi:signal transduction histidine kinase